MRVRQRRRLTLLQICDDTLSFANKTLGVITYDVKVHIFVSKTEHDSK
jgi:hypothetical protein